MSVVLGCVCVFMCPAGAVAPVVRDAHAKGLGAISSSVRSLSQSAQAGTLTPADVNGGTFTIVNLGAFGVRQFAAIISPPQVCVTDCGRERVVCRGEGFFSRVDVLNTRLSVCSHVPCRRLFWRLAQCPSVSSPALVRAPSVALPCFTLCVHLCTSRL